jgi:hypothetical protein
MGVAIQFGIVSSVSLACFCLCACGGGDADRPAANDAAATTTTAASAPTNLPATQAAFETELFSSYSRDLAEYQAAPNDIARSQAQDKWDADFCAFMTKHQSFDNWTGAITQLSKPNVHVIFNFDIGGGLTLADDPGPDLDLSSPAYRAISQLRVGDAATISGNFSVGSLGRCDSLPTKLLSDGKLEGTQFYIVLTKINGASASAG